MAPSEARVVTAERCQLEDLFGPPHTKSRCSRAFQRRASPIDDEYESGLGVAPNVGAAASLVTPGSPYRRQRDGPTATAGPRGGKSCTCTDGVPPEDAASWRFALSTGRDERIKCPRMSIGPRTDVGVARSQAE